MTALPPTRLSPSGQARRDQILALAQSALTARRRRRTVARASAAAALPILALVLVFVAARTAPPPAPPPAPVAAAPPTPSACPAFQIVRTDPNVLRRVRITTAPIPLSTLIDDEQLQDLLRTSGQDPGLIRVGHRVVRSSDLSAESAPDDPAHAPG